MIRIAAGGRIELPLAGLVVVHVVEGAVEVGGVRLAPGDTLRAEGEEGEVLALAAVEGSVAVVGTIGPVAG